MYGQHGNKCHKEGSRKVGGSFLPRPNWNNSWDREGRRINEKWKEGKVNKTKGRKILAWEKRMKEKENKIKVVQFVYSVPIVRVR